MLEVTAHLYAVKYSWEDKWVLKVCDSADMAEYSNASCVYVYIGPRTLTAQLPDAKTLILGAVSSLRAKQAAVLAEAQKEATAIEEIAQSFLALPYHG